MIKAVIFDIDGVLADSLAANHKFFTDLMNKYGYPFMKIEEYSGIFHMHMKDIIKHSTKLEDEQEIQKIWISGRDRDVRYPDELIIVPTKLEEIIKSLSKKYLLGIVTSRERAGIYSLPHLGKLKKFFKVEVAYSDTKEHKPHPEPLLLAAQKLGVEPSECVYVGDSKTDIHAAKAAGMKSIKFKGNIFKDADAHITEFSKLLEIIPNL